MRLHRKGMHRENKGGPKIAVCKNKIQGIMKEDDYKGAWEEKVMDLE